MLSCEKDEDFTRKRTKTPPSELSVQPGGNKSVDQLSSSTVEGFYRRVLEEQLDHHFYDWFTEEEGIINFHGTVVYADTSGFGKVAVVPVNKAYESRTNGVFVYVEMLGDNYTKYFQRADLEKRLANNNLSQNDFLAMHAILFNDTRTGAIQSWDEYLTATAILDNSKTASRNKNELCEGGRFMRVCASGHPESLDYWWAGLRRELGDNPFLREDYDNLSVEEVNGLFERWNQYQAAYQEALDNGQPPPNAGVYFGRYHDLYQRIISDGGAGAYGAYNAYNDYRTLLFEIGGIGGGPDGILGQYRRTGGIPRARDCQEIWVPCGEDPWDFEVATGGGGAPPGGDLYEPWKPIYDRLILCEGYDGIFDTGPDRGSSTNDPNNLRHPDYEFCSIWMEYYESCVAPDLQERCDIPSTISACTEDLLMDWARVAYNDFDIFSDLISGTNDCQDVSDIMDGEFLTEECTDRPLDVIERYRLPMNRAFYFAAIQEVRDNGFPCDDFVELDRLMLEAYFRQMGWKVTEETVAGLVNDEIPIDLLLDLGTEEDAQMIYELVNVIYRDRHIVSVDDIPLIEAELESMYNFLTERN